MYLNLVNVKWVQQWRDGGVVTVGRQEAWRKSEEQIYGCSARRPEASWRERRESRGWGGMEADDVFYFIFHCCGVEHLDGSVYASVSQETVVFTQTLTSENRKNK